MLWMNKKRPPHTFKRCCAGGRMTCVGFCCAFRHAKLRLRRPHSDNNRDVHRKLRRMWKRSWRSGCGSSRLRSLEGPPSGMIRVQSARGNKCIIPIGITDNYSGGRRLCQAPGEILHKHTGKICIIEGRGAWSAGLRQDDSAAQDRRSGPFLRNQAPQTPDSCRLSRLLQQRLKRVAQSFLQAISNIENV